MPAPSSSPITPDLWERLRRLDPHCDISIMRTIPLKRWRERGARRTWQVSIHPEAMRSTHQWVFAEHPTLAQAIREAIEAAEQRGWTK